MAKQYKTKSELLSHLINERKIIVGDEYSDILNYVRYNNLIDAYKDIISTNNLRGIHLYSPSTSIFDFVNISHINDYIAYRLIAFIDEYEKRLKLFVSDKICEAMVIAGSPNCCSYDLFDRTINEVDPVLSCFISSRYIYSNDVSKKLIIANNHVVSNRERVINKIKDLSAGTSAAELNYYSRDYLSKNNELPFYILVSNLSFSNLTTLFEMFTESIQIEFMKEVLKMEVVTFADISSLSSKNNIIRIIRNSTHHHEPVVPFLLKKKDHLDFNTKVNVITLLKDVYVSNPHKAKLDVIYCHDEEMLDEYISKQAKKLKLILQKVK